jgi:hypothetical protein
MKNDDLIREIKELAEQTYPENMEKVVEEEYEKLLKGLEVEAKRGSRQFSKYINRTDDLTPDNHPLLINRILKKAEEDGFYASLEQKMTDGGDILNYVTLYVNKGEYEKEKREKKYLIIRVILTLITLLTILGVVIGLMV